MKDEEEVYKALELSNEVANELDEHGNPAEAAGPIILRKALLWVVEEGNDNLLQELKEDYEEYVS